MNKTAALRVVLGDQLTPGLSALEGLDPARDRVLMMEVMKMMMEVMMVMMMMGVMMMMMMMVATTTIPLTMHHVYRHLMIVRVIHMRCYCPGYYHHHHHHQEKKR